MSYRKGHNTLRGRCGPEIECRIGRGGGGGGGGDTISQGGDPVLGLSVLG